MKICYISTKSIHTRRWVEYFAEKGHEVHLWGYICLELWLRGLVDDEVRK